MFDASRTRVALIRKSKPAWQAGKLNGIGGKIEAGEEAIAAMVREFREETSYETDDYMWSHFLRMGYNEDGGWSVDFFAAIGDLERIQSPEDEPTEIIWLDTITPMRADMIENLPWLIPLALDHLTDNRPSFVDVIYPK